MVKNKAFSDNQSGKARVSPLVLRVELVSMNSCLALICTHVNRYRNNYSYGCILGLIIYVYFLALPVEGPGAAVSQ